MAEQLAQATDNIDSLFENNMGLVVLLAKSFKPRNETEFEEYVQSGRIGLWKAYKSYKPELAKFTTIAWYCIRNEILREIYKHNKFSAKHGPISSSTLHESVSIENIEEYLPSNITKDEKMVLEKRLNGSTFLEIGKEMNCSSCWANKVYLGALKKIRGANEHS